MGWYANRFAFFFQKKILVEKMFQVMNTYIRFQQYCDDLYPLFKQAHGLHEKGLHEFLYKDGFEDLNIDKAARFFWFCGVIRERDAQITWNTLGFNKFESIAVQECTKHPDMCNSLNCKSIYHDEQLAALAAFNLKQRTSLE